MITRDSLYQFGQAIKAWRESKGLSLRAATEFIAVRTGETYSYSALGRLETGASQPDVDTLLLFERSGYSGLSMKEMLGILSGKSSNPESYSDSMTEFLTANEAISFCSAMSPSEKIELARRLLNSAAAENVRRQESD